MIVYVKLTWIFTFHEHFCWEVDSKWLQFYYSLKKLSPTGLEIITRWGWNKAFLHASILAYKLV